MFIMEKKKKFFNWGDIFLNEEIQFDSLNFTR